MGKLSLGLWRTFGGFEDHTMESGTIIIWKFKYWTPDYYQDYIVLKTAF